MSQGILLVPRYSIHTRLREFHLKRLLRKHSRGLMLDVGCGLGYLSEALGNGFVRAGIDIDLRALKENSKRGLNNMLQADAVKLPFKEGSFDIIICSEVLEHFQEGLDRSVLNEAARVLKPAGLLLITVPSLEGVRSMSRMRNLGHEDPSGGEYHYRPGYTRKDIEAMVNQNPFLNITNKRYSLFLFSELFMDVLKLAYLRKGSLKEHSDLAKTKDSLLFRFYRFIFPLLYFVFLAEDMILANLFKGHTLIISVEKKT